MFACEFCEIFENTFFSQKTFGGSFWADLIYLATESLKQQTLKIKSWSEKLLEIWSRYLFSKRKWESGF